jgi:excisionase family DNA binding protein
MAERGELKLWEAAQALNTGKMTALRLIRDGRIRARQPCPGGPWIVEKSDVDALATSSEYSGHRPVTLDPRQKTLDIQ